MEESNREIQERKTKQSDMKKKITEAEVTLDDINKKYTSLQLQISNFLPLMSSHKILSHFVKSVRRKKHKRKQEN